jgi:hypothetical protein
MRPSKWLVFIRSRLAGFDRSLTGLHLVSFSRFHAAPQQRGPVGMKVTFKGSKQLYDLCLCERNGFFVSFTLSYPADAWMKYGMTYTDVAHFIGWPKLKTKG